MVLLLTFAPQSQVLDIALYNSSSSSSSKVQTARGGAKNEGFDWAVVNWKDSGKDYSYRNRKLRD